jgi:hypothetical protein
VLLLVNKLHLFREIDVGVIQKDVPLVDQYSAVYLEYR